MEICEDHDCRGARRVSPKGLEGYCYTRENLPETVRRLRHQICRVAREELASLTGFDCSYPSRTEVDSLDMWADDFSAPSNILSVIVPEFLCRPEVD
jgi:hypothetical protein